MPRTLNTKTAVHSATTPLADVYRVLEVNINNEQGSLHVFYGAYEAQPDGIDDMPTPDVQVHREGVRYKGEAMLALANSATLAGETLHDAIKRVLYAKLEADGYFPSGGTDTDSEES